MPYIGKSPSQAVRNRYYFTVASGATSVSGSDDNSNTLIFADGTYVDVYLNGVLLVADTDYNTTTANTIAGLSAMSANDVVEVIVYDVFSVFSGNVNSDFSVGGDLSVTGGVEGGIVFNEGSADVDFRVESNSDTHVLFVDGGNNAVGIKTSVPASFGSFAIRGAIDTASGTNHGIVSASFSDAITGTFSIAHASGLVSLLTDQKFAFVTDTNKVGMKIDNTGAVTKPLQPAFLATPASAQNNIPINTTTTIVLGTEVYDVNADFASNTFTAPITGKYQLCLQVSMQNLDTATDYYQLDIVTSNRTYQFLYDPTHHSADVTYAVFTVSALADMDASDTAFARLYIPNSGAAQADVTTGTYFSGFLAC